MKGRTTPWSHDMPLDRAPNPLASLFFDIDGKGQHQPSLDRRSHQRRAKDV